MKYPDIGAVRGEGIKSKPNNKTKAKFTTAATIAAAGFTLVEILVACAILVMLVVLVAQMVNSATIVTKISERKMDADDEARIVFDRMSGDFAQMLRRADVDPVFLGKPGNDQMYFYSQAPAFFDNPTPSAGSQIALIGYQVMSNGLARLGEEESWDALSFNSTNLTTNVTREDLYYQSGQSNNFHIIAPSVFRMEFALRMRPGSVNNLSNGPVTSVSTNATTNGFNVFFQTNNAGQSLHDVAGIVVALAILDQTSQKIVTPAELTNLANVNVMPDAVITPSAGGLLTGLSNNGIAADLWSSNALQVPGIPPPARAQIRVYERYFPITP